MVKIEGLDLEGRERAAVDDWEGWARSEVSWEVKAKVVDDGISFARENSGRGMP